VTERLSPTRWVCERCGVWEVDARFVMCLLTSHAEGTYMFPILSSADPDREVILQV